jgi:LytS/YehU family sensor histidine kinase
VPGHLLITFYAAKAIGDSTRFLYRHAQEQTRRAERAQAEATRAQLEALQAQLNPHFLFNALNTIAALVRTDARAAERTVEDLAHVLRRTLDRAKRARVRLDEELAFVRAYLAVENARFGPRLHVEWAIEEGALACAVPPLTLQPLVENALKHAFAQRIDGGHVHIAAERADGILRLRVQDDGAGFANEWREGGGLGNLRGRLDNLYGDAASIEVRNDSGAMVTITLPAELASDARSDRR